MDKFRIVNTIVVALLVFGAIFVRQNLLLAQPSPPAPADNSQDEQVLTRGPVHEAFAVTVTFDPQAGIVVPKAPPAPIEEMPPDQRPEGANVTWIPGYWAWDDERNDFLWVSGIWRDLPVGREWVPGYWTQTDGGYQWTSGYWADAKTTEVDYLPEPPQSVEAGPNIAAPSENYSWLPGVWLWRQTRYVWRPGFWAVMQPDWVWTPDHYVWTPGGYVFVAGYWDYALARRGVLFAPVYFRRPIYRRPRFFYSPGIVIGVNAFVGNLFLRPRYCHYYFGDYYAANYGRAGFYPWFSYGRHGGYDPFFAHQRWEHRRDRDWDRRIEREFTDRREHVDLRPPRTFALQQALLARQPNAKNFVIGDRFTQVVAEKNGPIRFQPVNKIEREDFLKQAQTLHVARQERQKEEFKRLPVEREGKVIPRPGKPSIPEFKPTIPNKLPEKTIPKPTPKPGERIEREPNRREPQIKPGVESPTIGHGRLPHTPFVSKPAGPQDKLHITPKEHLAPKPDLKVEPKPRPRTPPPPRNNPPKGKGAEEKKKG